MWSTAGGHIEFLLCSKYISKYKFRSRRSPKKGREMAEISEKDKLDIRLSWCASQKEVQP
jgi:hypothetical protein